MTRLLVAIRIRNTDRSPDNAQGNFVSNLADRHPADRHTYRQTNKQSKTAKNINSFSRDSHVI